MDVNKKSSSSVLEMEENKKKFDKKTAKTRRETAVQGTNDSSIVSKCSMAQTGYFEDDYLKHFCSKVTRRAPLIHRGYFIRAKTIDTLLSEFLDKHKDRESQIISLGAGFDSAYFRLKASNKLGKTKFIEVDFPDVVNRKCKLILSNNILKDLISKDDSIFTLSQHPLIQINSGEYVLLGADLTQLNTLEALLALCKVDFELPTLLLSECVLTYMTKRCSTAVIRWASETFPNAMFVLYEQVEPDDSFGLFMQKHFRIIGSPIKCINAFPTVSAQIERCLNQGWDRVEGLDMNQFYNLLLTKEEQHQLEKLEPFDEYEEWCLKCSHYAVICSYNGDCPSLLYQNTKNIFQKQEILKNNRPIVEVRFPGSEQQLILRVGHSSTEVSNNIMVTCGFGDEKGKHQRLGDILLLSKDLQFVTKVVPEVDLKPVELNRMHHVICQLKDGSVLMVGGRMSPLKLCTQMLRININQIILDGMSSKNESKTQDFSSKECTNDTKEPHCTQTGGGDKNYAPGNCLDVMSKMSGLSLTHDDNLQLVKIEALGQHGQIPKPRWRHCLTVFEKDGYEFLWMFGGRTISTFALDDMFIYDLATSSWTEVKAQGQEWPEARQAHSAAKGSDDKVYISGGLDINLKPLKSVFEFSFKNNTWKKLNIETPLLERFSHTSHVIGDFLVLVGGVNTNSTQPGVAIIHIPTQQSMEFSMPEQQEEQLLMLHRHTSVYFGNYCIVVIGGGGNCFSFGTHFNRSPFVLDISHCLDFMRQTLNLC